MSSPLREASIRFIWSSWGEFGVPSMERRSFDMAIDLEALIRLTGTVGAGDSRLLSTTARWLQSFPELVSKARLKRIGGDLPNVARSTPRDFMSGTIPLDVTPASAVQLRIRSALGVSARAEIIRQLTVDARGTRRTAFELAQLAGYTKRNIEKALESLERGRWVTRVRGGASLRWVLTDHRAVAELFSPQPRSNTSFLALAEIIENLVMLDRVSSAKSQVRSASTRQALSALQPTADWGEVALPQLSVADDTWGTVLAWIAGLPVTAQEAHRSFMP